MKRRTLAIAVAALLALFGTAAVLAYTHKANERAVEGLKAETVMMAATAIPAGTTLREANQNKWLTNEEVPVGSLSVTPVKSVTAANENLVFSGPVGRGQLLLQPMLGKTATPTSSGVALPVPPGKVAVSMQLCLSAAVADFIGPGSEVAVFATFSTVKKAQNQQVSCGSNPGQYINTVFTQIVLPRIEVLCVGQGPACPQANSTGSTSTIADPSAGSQSSQGSVLVTFAATQAEAERLITLQEAGLPYLALTSTSSSTGPDSGLTSLFGPDSGLASLFPNVSP